MSTFEKARLDAAESVFFKRQLEAIDRQAYEVLYPELRGRSLVPTQAGIPDWARTYTWRMFDRFGKAKFISNTADDLPRADAKGEENSKVIKNLGASYGWNIFEIKAAAATGTPLDAMKAQGARFAIEEKIDEVLAVGDADHNLEGLLNLTGAATFTPSTKSGGGTTWGTVSAPNADPDEIVGDLFGIVAGRFAAMKLAGGPPFSRFVIVLPMEQYAHIAQRRMGDGSDTTILRFALANSPWIEAIEPWYRADGAGAGATDRMVAYPRNPLAVAAIIPMEFQTLEPEKRNLEFVIDAIASTGGVVTRYPVAVAYGDGI